MKLAIISDLHSTHWRREQSWQSRVDYIKRRVDDERPDLIIDAGDAECDVAQLLGVGYVFQVMGNHDWYGRDFDPASRGEEGTKRGTQAWWNGSRLVVGCTLWTDYNGADPVTMSVVGRALNDTVWIDNFSADEALAEHRADRRWLETYSARNGNTPPDVVVTHHAPSWKSVHPRFVRPGALENHINYGFVSRIEDLVEEVSPKLWIHGHVHDPVDYTIGTTRVVANPHGYPHERLYLPFYEPLFIEL